MQLLVHANDEVCLARYPEVQLAKHTRSPTAFEEKN